MLTGGGTLATPASAGNLRPIASFPPDASGTASVSGTANPNSWTTVAGIMGALDSVASVWNAYAMCSYDTALQTVVATGDILNCTPPRAPPSAPPRSFRGPRRAPPTWPPWTGHPVPGVGRLPPQGDGYYGFNIIGDFASDAAGTPSGNGATNPTDWTGVIHTGGIAIPSVDLTPARCARRSRPRLPPPRSP